MTGIHLTSPDGDPYIAADQTEAKRLIFGHGYQVADKKPAPRRATANKTARRAMARKKTTAKPAAKPVDKLTETPAE